MTLTLPGPGLNLNQTIERPRLKKASISVTAFVGFLNSAHVFQTIKIDSWTHFRGIFGESQSDCARAVFGYFDNGGKDAYLVDLGARSDSTEDEQEKWQKAVDALDCCDEISLVTIPGITDPLAIEQMERHCSERKDRMLLLESPKSGLENWKIPKSRYIAIYHPWIRMIDPISGNEVVQPPSGHIAGIFARTEASRGSHVAPANAKIHGATAVLEPLSRRRREQLFSESVNLIRDDTAFGGEIKVWGAKTRSSDPKWQSLSARRMVTMIIRSLALGTQWVVHERQGPELWQELKLQIGEFLEELRLSGLLVGETENDAFYVKCDQEFNPIERIGADQVIFEIGLCPVKARDFNIIRLCQWPGGLEVAE